MYLAQELLTNRQCSGGSRSFAKRMRALKMRSTVAGHVWQWPAERVIEADPLTTTWEVAEELSVDHSMVIQHLKQIGKMKKLEKWVLHELTENLKKNCHFEVSSSLLLCNNDKPFLNWLWRAMKSGFYDSWWQQWMDWEEAPKHFSKPDLHQKKWSWSLFGGLLPVWSGTGFWIPVQSLHLRSMISKSMRCTENCKACSQHWSIERAHFFSRTMPDCRSHNHRFESWTNWAMRLYLFHLIHWLLANWLLLLQASQQLFSGEMLHNHQEAKMLSKSSSNPKAWIFML